ncbi:ABC transporter ATP-binding protein [Roseiarcus sp.]|uniref:ABC transporter ATP-binding protein n=1 Tax=Roseiarcus sp. TaxID=1969460 RepID=UPI002D117F2C|nr:ABC transporter ATP-binding protein [Roseiarcus sp.]
MTAILEAKGLEKRFGGSVIVAGISLHVAEGERRLIIGPNGAGKTTLLNLLSGDLSPDAGGIWFAGRRVERLSAARRARLGVGRTFQVLTLFEGNTVIENVVIAALGAQARRWDPFTPFRKIGQAERAAMEALRMVDLLPLAAKRVADCAYGQKRRLEMALALAQAPKLLLLDEPFAGLSATERSQVLDVILNLPGEVAIVMIEHDMDVALKFARNISVMQAGRIVVEGSKSEVIAAPRTREVYLGR